MKILYKNATFNGGAPKSLLEYIKIANKNGIESVAVGMFSDNMEPYINSGVKVINLKAFKLERPIRNFFILLHYIEIIKKERPDVIHTITTENCIFHKLIENTMGIYLIKTIPGGKISKYKSKLLKGEHLLVFSDENKMDLLEYGHDSEKITVISNRIDFSHATNDCESFYGDLHTNRNKPIKLLVISRLVKSKINSIITVINLCKRLKEDGYNVKLDILGDGESLDELKTMANELNIQYQSNLITLHGYQDNVDEFIRRAHFVFGKGRCVIDGIRNYRITLIPNESREICLCDTENFIELKTHNLTGRNLKESTSYDEFVEIIESLLAGGFPLNKLEEINILAKVHYDIKLSEEKIIKMYNNVEVGHINYSPNLFNIIKEFINLYLRAVKIKYVG